ncbi:hypothetical protein [Ferruginibacter sp. SUN106]|uniref:hypothetical protein n=1 Tax=Ferruginibacter sp. SUN106 TaxID=2978348 RepID=UPI003D366879
MEELTKGIMPKGAEPPKMPRGAQPSPRYKLAEASPHQIIGLTPDNYLHVAQNLSFWGNNIYGDCVTAEEAFAKGCGNPEVFIPEQLAIDWASDNGFLNGAVISEVLDRMTKVGFRINDSTYNDGNFNGVNWTNTSVLHNAIAMAPVKIGIAADQLEIAYHRRPTNAGWFATGFSPEANEDHCISLCGYGTLAWLASQFHVTLPSGLNGQDIGYAFFTWNSIGIIDRNSMLAITHEAWLRNPTTQITNVFILKLQAHGGETGKYLSHAHANVYLNDHYGGWGEAWICHILGNNEISIECHGAEKGLYLSHAYGNIGLQNGYQGAGEAWAMHNLGDGKFSLECLGGERGRYLSHAYGNIGLQNGYQGSGEMWSNTGRY